VTDKLVISANHAYLQSANALDRPIGPLHI